MTVCEILKKMISYSQGNLHDINHFLKVYAFARTIGLGEGLSPTEQQTVEIAAILHDIACPLCREKYGNTAGPYQEKEGVRLTREFLSDCQLPDDMVDRIVYLVGHHHTITDVQGKDYQILLEADYLVNADESHCSPDHIKTALKTLYRTKTGTALLHSVYGV